MTIFSIFFSFIILSIDSVKVFNFFSGLLLVNKGQLLIAIEIIM